MSDDVQDFVDGLLKATKDNPDQVRDSFRASLANDVFIVNEDGTETPAPPDSEGNPDAADDQAPR